MDFRGLFAHFKEMKHYFIVVLLVFTASLYLGWQFSGQYASFLGAQVSGLQELGDKLGASKHPQLMFFIVIFLNNALKSILIVFLGLLAGVLPLYMLVTNGMVLGYVLSLQHSDNLLMLIVKGILPHGIIELPMVMLACAYGLKLGILVGKSILQVFVPNDKKTARRELRRVFNLTLPLCVLITGALLVAAAIESSLTMWLVGQ
ncbi:stage II sporulation protein M [Paenibacillus athensensis]|uniref:Stage II sporulation protein M n=1 Tax=Paenibacillus athensensis TaxID=1967502 RepID=A0A4Y8PUY7_9BACL|nr:stage II sporulation protein M [Paenibacillus athensensis]MCD1261991.1 stage II sporulation protein M [Paenibacillus athensensis]